MTGLEQAASYGIDEKVAQEVCAAVPGKYHPEKWTAAEWQAEARRFTQLGPEEYRQTLLLVEALRQNYEEWAQRGQRAAAEQTADLSAPYSRQRQETGWSTRRPEDRHAPAN